MEVTGRGRVVFLILLSCAMAARAQDSSHTIFHTFSSDCRNAARSGLQVVQKPLHGSANDYLIAGGLLAGIAATSALDRSVRSASQKAEFAGWQENIADFGHAYSAAWTLFGTAAALYGTGLAVGNPNIRRTGYELVETFLIAQAGTQTLKRVIGRNRPYLENGPFHFNGPSQENKYNSFPSGDVTNAFALSTVLAAEAKSLPITVVLYGLAATTAYQRIHRDQHWLSDTAASAVWATAVGLAVVHQNRANGKNLQLRLGARGARAELALSF